MTLGVTLDQARQIIAGTLAAGHDAGFQPLTVVVLDAGGHVTAVEREDGSSNNRFQIAHGKAYGALAFGFGSREFGNRVAGGSSAFVLAANSALGGALVPVPGGVLVKDADGTMLGAVGVSGDNSDNDEAAAVAGIEGVSLVAQPD
jgi:uncharacterized protein GlcG (DUF336 family)